MPPWRRSKMSSSNSKVRVKTRQNVKTRPRNGLTNCAWRSPLNDSVTRTSSHSASQWRPAKLNCARPKPLAAQSQESKSAEAAIEKQKAECAELEATVTAVTDQRAEHSRAMTEME